MKDGCTLSISNFSAWYQSRTVVDGLSLPSIQAGKVVALVGPNGAGKSTLLRALAGLIPAKGSARLGPLELIGCSAGERANRVGFMPQGFPAHSSLTVLESVIVAFRAMPRSTDLDHDRRVTGLRALSVLDRIGIAHLGLRPLDQLSGGQRQLASLAQAIVRDPLLLLLDEPTSALDLRHQVEVMELLRSLAGEGRIVIVVLHDLTLAARWADDIVLLDHGKVHASGSPDSAITSGTLASVYGVRARVEADPLAGLRITVDGTTDASDTGGSHPASRTGRKWRK